MHSYPDIVLLGTGNVGTHIGHRFVECGLPIREIYSQTEQNALKLAKELKAKSISDLGKVRTNAQLYLLALKDDVLSSVAKALQNRVNPEALIVHTSGATPSSIFEGYFQHYGVFYPLQTFSKNQPLDFSVVPMCIYANSPEKEDWLVDIAQQLSNKIYRINDEQRTILHVAAVFANNFSNHLFHLSNQILDGENLPFELLHALIQETVKKATLGNPSKMQTGPAIRGDQQTIERHLAYLKDQPDLAELYKKLSLSINKNLNL